SNGGGAPFAYVRSTPPPPPTGEYNHDHQVNAADYTVWRNTFGEPVPGLGQGADGNESGTIEIGDFNFWKLHYGEPAGSGAAIGQIAVPEPGTMVLFFTGLLMSIRPRGCRRIGRI